MDSTLLGLMLDSSVIKHAARKKQTVYSTGELIGKVRGEQDAKGIRLPFDDLAIGASALEQG